jgi:hypothetical protein
VVVDIWIWENVLDSFGQPLHLDQGDKVLVRALLLGLNKGLATLSHVGSKWY